MSVPHILVGAGPDAAHLTQVRVNADTAPLEIESPHFVGRVTVRLAPHFELAEAESQYFHKREGGATWSIGIEGRFLGKDYTADDIMFGNTWDKPIRDHLPYGTSAGLKFIKLVDPSLTHDLYADKPHAESPLLATMNYVSASKWDATQSEKESLPPWVAEPIEDNVSSLFTSPELAPAVANMSARKKFFSDQTRRQSIKITADDVISCDFCNGYIDFSTLSLKLPIGLSVSLKEHWDGQPITFICQSRDRTVTFFVVTFQIGNEETEAEYATMPQAIKESDPVEVDKDDLGVD